MSLFEVLGTDISANLPFMAAGLDSVASMEFANALADYYDTKIPATLLFEHPTLVSLTNFL